MSIKVTKAPCDSIWNAPKTINGRRLSFGMQKLDLGFREMGNLLDLSTWTVCGLVDGWLATDAAGWQEIWSRLEKEAAR